MKKLIAVRWRAHGDTDLKVDCQSLFSSRRWQNLSCCNATSAEHSHHWNPLWWSQECTLCIKTALPWTIWTFSLWLHVIPPIAVTHLRFISDFIPCHVHLSRNPRPTWHQSRWLEDQWTGSVLFRKISETRREGKLAFHSRNSKNLPHLGLQVVHNTPSINRARSFMSIPERWSSKVTLDRLYIQTNPDFRPLWPSLFKQ